MAPAPEHRMEDMLKAPRCMKLGAFKMSSKNSSFFRYLEPPIGIPKNS